MLRDEHSTPSNSSMDLLRLLEYLAVISAAVGSLAAAWFGKILYAASPMSVALFLNLINRQRLEQSTQQTHYRTDAAIADVQTVVQSLHDQVHAQASDSGELDSMTQVLTELQRVTKSLESDVLRQQDWEVMNVQFKLMMENAIADLKASADFKPHAAEDLEVTQPLLGSSQSAVESSSQPHLDGLILQARLELIHQQVIELDRQNRELVKPYLQRLIQAVKQLQK
ncbi:MAG: hypothetical protein ACRC8A_17735 [Microcoleaceae cyanobacterium]